MLSTPRVAVVTGGSSGIGEALARRLTARGWRCVLVARGEERLRALAGELGADWHACDVGDRESVESLAEAVRAQHRAVNLLVNNAGVPARRDFLSAEPDVVERVMRINYLGTLWPTRALLPALREGMPDTRVVNVVSVAGHVAFVPAGPYTASKHAQLGREGIRVHTVCPGFVATEGFPQKDLVRHPVLKRIVIGPDRVADHVLNVIESGRAETFVPGYYRVAALAQALMPRLVGRFAARSPGG